MKVILCSSHFSASYLKDIRAMIPSNYTIAVSPLQFLPYITKYKENCLFISGNAMNEKNNRVQIKASSKPGSNHIVSFMEIDTFLPILDMTAFPRYVY
jgi:hypothetical protein